MHVSWPICVSQSVSISAYFSWPMRLCGYVVFLFFGTCFYVNECISWCVVWYASFPICSSRNVGHHPGHLPLPFNPSRSPVRSAPRNLWNLALLPLLLPPHLDDCNNSLCVSDFAPSIAFPHSSQRTFLKLKSGYTLTTFQHPHPCSKDKAPNPG